jgi:hypothetical protein
MGLKNELSLHVIINTIKHFFNTLVGYDQWQIPARFSVCVGKSEYRNEICKIETKLTGKPGR